MGINSSVVYPIYTNNCFLNKKQAGNLRLNTSPATDTFERISFKGLDAKSKFEEIGEIKSEEEYDSTLQKIMNDKSWNHANWDIKGTDKYQLGLMPYVGILDIHSEINYFVRNGKLYYHEGICNSVKTEEMMKNYIKVMNYALKKLDEKYGTYNGIVYRYGYFKNDDSTSGYVSTAKDPIGAIQIGGERPFTCPYFIIMAKNGHKIIDMQKEIDYPDSFKRGYTSENEILLDPNKKYERINIKTPEMEEAEQNLINAFKAKFPKLKEDIIKSNLRIFFLKEC